MVNVYVVRDSLNLFSSSFYHPGWVTYHTHGIRGAAPLVAQELRRKRLA